MNKLFFFLLLTTFSIGWAQAQYDTLKTASGLKYVVLKKGTGAQPVKGQKVKVNYTGKLPNGKVFDTTLKGPSGPFQFKIGNREVIPGWDEGFLLMHVGEKGILFIPANLAYGSHGVPDEENPGQYIIPPNAELMFEVELISIK
ncbi:MAG: peptidylprolyl isomerase [Chitinophagaceae bacterium]|nr:peptidylprolyl isomerase [Chitinophagaceae bacterium]